jgi:DNA-damage-inducible protein D
MTHFSQVIIIRTVSIMFFNSNVIAKAKVDCETTGEAVSDHFVDVTKTIQMPKGASKEVPDFMLTRYASYLIAQDGDPKSS